MSNNFDEKLLAPCGINCGTCVAFFGYTMSGKKRKHSCNGCWTRKNLCAFIKKKCEKLTNKKLDFCFDCDYFPCQVLEKLDSQYVEKYGMSLVENLKNIQRNGIDEYLKHEKERWKCPSCEGVVCVHNKKCYSCGVTQ